jgi:hypothetical protein
VCPEWPGKAIEQGGAVYESKDKFTFSPLDKDSTYIGLCPVAETMIDDQEFNNYGDVRSIGATLN